MKKILLSAQAFVALGFAQNTQSVEEPELERAVLALNAANEANAKELREVKLKLQAFEDAEKIANEQQITAMVNLAVQEGRITADKVETFKTLASQNFDLAKNTLEALPKAANLGAGVQTPGGAAEMMTEEKFQTLSVQAQKDWKDANPDEYTKLFA